jgi:hypothetical protein
MERQESNHRVKLTAIACFILTILLCVSPCGAEFVDVGETADIDYAIEGDFLDVLGTANLYPGAYVDYGVYAATGCIVNIYGGEIGDGFFVLLYTGEPIPVVTVYGTDFAVDTGTIEDGSWWLPGGGSGTLTGLYENGDPINLWFLSDVPIFLCYLDTEIAIDIDIRPYCNKNFINLDIRGFVPVAVLTTDDFDAATVDPATVEFAGAGPVCWKLRDVDRDGDDDMILHFRMQELNLDQDSTEATLTGQTTQGILIEGSDEVQIISFCRKYFKNKFHRPFWRVRNCRRPFISPRKGCKH